MKKIQTKKVVTRAKEELSNLLDIQNRFPDEQSCRDFFEQTRWNGKIICPHCKSERISKFKNGRTYFCAECRKQFTVKVGTILEDSPIALQKWFFAIFILTAHKKGISSCQLARDIKVTQKTAWFMTQRIRHAMKTKSLLNPLENTVEADETYIGGKNKNRHKNKKVKGSQGRSSKDKTAVFGLIERQGELRANPVLNVSKKTLQTIISDNVSKDATLMTDEWKAYKGLDKNFKGHYVVNHSTGEYVINNAHTNTIEGFWSLLKRGIVGIYHHVSKEHLHRYCNEFGYRYNTRDMSDTGRFYKTMNNFEGRLMYKTLIKNLNF